VNELDLTRCSRAKVAVAPPPLGEDKKAALRRSAVEVLDR
jgi:hypothetical protein